MRPSTVSSGYTGMAELYFYVFVEQNLILNTDNSKAVKETDLLNRNQFFGISTKQLKSR